MTLFYRLISFAAIVFINYSCNTFYNTKLIDIEIVEPGEIKISDEFRKIAIRYNNSNVSPNPYFQNSHFDDIIIENTTNIDSIASKIYYQYFLDEVRKQKFFDTIIEIAPQDFSNITILDTLNYVFDTEIDSILNDEKQREKLNVFIFSNILNEHPIANKAQATNKFLHPRFALYQANELNQIADSTQTDLLISLDYFSSLDKIQYNPKSFHASEVVFTNTCWNFYDLKKQKYLFPLSRTDSLLWHKYEINSKRASQVLPPSQDAVYNAADIAGTRLANFMIPHWIEVQRMYYGSGHYELKETEKLIEEGKWQEAAEIWKANTNNPNKSIAAKSKFNMGLACEMQGHLDAALEWVVESYYVLKQENEEHRSNCMVYIQILSQRKLDMKRIQNQYGAY
jgi:hypothetical protein